MNYEVDEIKHRPLPKELLDHFTVRFLGVPHTYIDENRKISVRYEMPKRTKRIRRKAKA